MKVIFACTVTFFLGVVGGVGISQYAFGALIQLSVETDIDHAVTIREHIEIGNIDHVKRLLALKADCGRLDLEKRSDTWYFQESDYTRKVIERAGSYSGHCSETGT